MQGDEHVHQRRLCHYLLPPRAIAVHRRFVFGARSATSRLSYCQVSLIGKLCGLRSARTRETAVTVFNMH